MGKGRYGFGILSLRAVFAAGAVVMLAAASAVAQSDANPPSAPLAGQNLGKSLPTREMNADEHLAMPQFPAGWVQTVKQTGSIEVFEYIPKNQTDTTWVDKITLEVHHDTFTLPLDAYQRRALGQMQENCDGIREGKLQTGINNGFPTAYWTMGCQHDKRGEFGELRYTKAIQGSATLYLLSRSWRTQIYGDEGPNVTPQMIDAAKSFLGSAVVCASTGQHPCPAGDNPAKQ